MTELIVCLGDDATDSYVRKLVESEDWDKILLITTDKQKTFKSSKAMKLVTLDANHKLKEMVQDLSKTFSKDTKSIEVAVNIVAAKGKLGMAVIAALLSSGKGIRLVAWGKDGLIVF